VGLTAFVVGQLVLDVIVVGALFTLLRRRRRLGSAGAPPAWYQEFLRLVEDLLAVTEPVLTALESPAPAPRADVPPRPESPRTPDQSGPSARYRAAFALLRAGGRREEIARRGQLLPRELRLIESLLAAESRLPSRGQ
jgi:hypothetical protein